jgi:hypothetical protein
VINSTGISTKSAEPLPQAEASTASTANALNLSLSDLLSNTSALSKSASTPHTVDSGGVVTTVNLSQGDGSANQWHGSGSATVNGVIYDVYHNATQGASTVADLLIQHAGITVHLV